jgi:hypothetical protein
VAVRVIKFRLPSGETETLITSLTGKEYKHKIFKGLYEEAQELVEEDQRGRENKWEYQVNVNHEIGVIKDRLIVLLLEDDRKKRGVMFEEMIGLLKRRIIPIRPNRSFPRELPRKVKFHHNHKSNC